MPRCISRLSRLVAGTRTPNSSRNRVAFEFISDERAGFAAFLHDARADVRQFHTRKPSKSLMPLGALCLGSVPRDHVTFRRVTPCQCRGDVDVIISITAICIKSARIVEHETTQKFATRRDESASARARVGTNDATYPRGRCVYNEINVSLSPRDGVYARIRSDDE